VYPPEYDSEKQAKDSHEQLEQSLAVIAGKTGHEPVKSRHHV